MKQQKLMFTKDLSSFERCVLIGATVGATTGVCISTCAGYSLMQDPKDALYNMPFHKKILYLTSSNTFYGLLGCVVGSIVGATSPILIPIFAFSLFTLGIDFTRRKFAGKNE